MMPTPKIMQVLKYDKSMGIHVLKSVMVCLNNLYTICQLLYLKCVFGWEIIHSWEHNKCKMIEDVLVDGTLIDGNVWWKNQIVVTLEYPIYVIDIFQMF